MLMMKIVLFHLVSITDRNQVTGGIDTTQYNILYIRVLKYATGILYTIVEMVWKVLATWNTF